MARRRDAGELDLAQGPGRGRQSARGLDPRSDDVARNLLRNAKAEFDVESKKTPYFSLLPPTPSPTIETNRAEMEKHRAAMRQLYLNKAVRFQ